MNKEDPREKEPALVVTSLADQLQIEGIEEQTSETDSANYMAEFISEGNWTELIGIEEEIQLAPAKLSETPPEFISGLLDQCIMKELISLLKEFKDRFAWHYHEMPGLDKGLVQHRLPIKEGCRPMKQLKRRMSIETEWKAKEEIERLLKAGFIRPARYVEWLANIVHVLKKVTKVVRVCVDYRNLNEATPKDEYPMPMADMLIDGVAHNKILSFMDGKAGYNQIMVAEKDIHKTTFRCPGAVGVYEYIVMPFGLKNAGATYQRAMNVIFHDMIEHTLEVYIDDVIINSQEQEEQVEEQSKSDYRRPCPSQQDRIAEPAWEDQLFKAVHRQFSREGATILFIAQDK
ncbi:hypothetical protein CerSpe_273660 [Prunus speciosa]